MKRRESKEEKKGERERREGKEVKGKEKYRK